jgi:hypothetical protein
MKKLLLIVLLMGAWLQADVVPGVFHLMYTNGTVTVSGSDTFFEFDVQAYITGTSNTDDLKLGAANIYVQYDTDIFGSNIMGTSNIEITKIGVLEGDIIPNIIAKYNIVGESNNTFSDVFAITPVATSPSGASLYSNLSTDSENPSDLLHVKMKAIASGSGELIFPISRIIDPHNQFQTLAGMQYEGPQDFSAAVEPVYIEGPVDGEPYTSIELDYFSADNKGGSVRLRWRTQSETQNLGFIIKRTIVFDNGMYGAYEVIDSYKENDDLLGAGTTTKKTDYLYWDREVKPGVTYAYVLQDVDEGGHIRECDPVIVTVKESKVISTDKFEFTASYPNPFNPSFVVPFELFELTNLDIRLYDVTGRLVKVIAASKDFSPGQYNLIVDGKELSSGMYILKIMADNIMNTQKMLLVK